MQTTMESQQAVGHGNISTLEKVLGPRGLTPQGDDRASRDVTPAAMPA
jgi:hypothetical protein